MAHLHKKIKKGRPYYYLREIQRVNGMPKVVSQIYLGSPERIAERMSAAVQQQRPIKVQSRSFGALFIAHELEKQLDTIGIIDSIVPPALRETGPSIGEYFFYAWANHLIDPKSKHALPKWYSRTAVQEIRPTDIASLTSQRFWEKWERVSAEDVERIAQKFFARVWKLQLFPPESVMFDTTNYYTYMSSHTDSQLCQRGHNKAGKHHLRQVGLALLADRKTRLPLYFRAYEGNEHDSKLFRSIIDEMFGVICGFNQTKQRLTVVFDKGMNSEEAIQTIDDHSRIHFITTYSTYFADELAATDIKKFTPLGIEKNRRLIAEENTDDCMQAYRSSLELWGRERTAVVTYNPRSARKHSYNLQRKLEELRTILLEFRRKYREGLSHWRSADAIKERYQRACDKLHISANYYQLEFGGSRKSPELSFRKNVYQVSKAESMFGKNIIVTDNSDWTTDEIVQFSLDRYIIEEQFRTSKRQIKTNPFYHWTDSKIRCQMLTCIIALTVQRLIEITVNEKKGTSHISSAEILSEMAELDSVLLWYADKRKPERILEAPTKLQSEVLNAFGWSINRSGVLQHL